MTHEYNYMHNGRGLYYYYGSRAAGMDVVSKLKSLVLFIHDSNIIVIVQMNNASIGII